MRENFGPGYDRWLTSPPEEPRMYRCPECGEDEVTPDRDDPCADCEARCEVCNERAGRVHLEDGVCWECIGRFQDQELWG